MARRARCLALIALFAATPALPCSFDETPALFFRKRPDAPAALYAHGRLGVVLPTYARSHLVVAYRYFSVRTPTAEEKKGFAALLEHRLGESGSEPESAHWERARGEVLGVVAPRAPSATRPAHDYGWFTNCNDDAFRLAAATLRKRVETFGAKSPAVLSWLDAQDTVFANCSEGTARIPEAADATLPALIRYDRAYQIAAAHFYAMDYNRARHEFAAVARDAHSPWNQLARIGAVRAMLRKTTIGPSELDLLPVAERELRAILADPAAASIHDAIDDLLAFTVFRTNKPQRIAGTVRTLLGDGSPAKRVARDLADYTYLLDKEVVSDDDLTQWVLNFQRAPAGIALQKWRATKKRHWLIAALSQATTKEANELLAASQEIDEDSPAYPTIAYHRARLLLAKNQRNAARAELDRVLALKHLPASGRNLLLEQRRAVARSLADYLRDAQPVTVGREIEQHVYEWDTPQALLPPDAAKIINESMPLDTLASAATSEKLAETIRKPLVVAAWTRAILLERRDVAAELTPHVLRFYPALAPRVQKWENATGDRRRFAAADLLVHFPGLNPYAVELDSRVVTFGDIEDVSTNWRNWWCAGGARYGRYPDEPSPKPLVPPFLAGELVREAAAKERRALERLGAGPAWILRNVIAWARARPDDRGVAEALALAVRGTRWGCYSDEAIPLAERAFRLLHTRYANTKWAKETPYWHHPDR